MPAGARLKYRSNIPAYAHYTFEGVDETFHDRAMANKQNSVANIVVAGVSYGQGSSREHAAICPMYLGVKAVLAKSFERIHQANLCNFGILPLEFVTESDYERIEQGDELEIVHVGSALEEMVASGTPIVVYNRTQSCDIPTTARITTRQLAMLKAGGLLNYTKQS